MCSFYWYYIWEYWSSILNNTIIYIDISPPVNEVFGKSKPWPPGVGMRFCPPIMSLMLGWLSWGSPFPEPSMLTEGLLYVFSRDWCSLYGIRWKYSIRSNSHLKSSRSLIACWSKFMKCFAKYEWKEILKSIYFNPGLWANYLPAGNH